MDFVSSVGLVSLFAALGLWLFARKLLSTALQTMTADLMRWLLSFISNSRLSCLFASAGLSFCTQSSLNISYMAASYTNSGLFSSGQLTALLAASSIGTVLTSFVFAFNWGWFELLFIAVGFWLFLAARREILTSFGMSVAAVGLFMLGARLLTEGLSARAGFLLSLRVMAENAPDTLLMNLGAVAIGAILCLLLRSKLIVIATLIIAFEVDIFPTHLVIPLIVGAFWTEGLLLLVNSLGLTTKVKRGVLSYLFALLTSGLLALIFKTEFFLFANGSLKLMGTYSHLVEGEYVSTLMIPFMFLYHCLFLMVVHEVLRKPFELLAFKVWPEKSVKEAHSLKFVGNSFQAGSVLLIEQAFQELRKLSAMVDSILQLTLNHFDPESQADDDSQRIVKYEKITDHLQREMQVFVGRVIELPLSRGQGRSVQSILKMTSELEEIADCCLSIFKLQQGFDKRLQAEHSEVFTKVQKLLSEIIDHYELIFSDLADTEESSVFSSKTGDQHFRTQSFDIKSSYLNTMRELFGSESAAHGHLIGEILFKTDRIGDCVLNLYKTYKTIK